MDMDLARHLLSFADKGAISAEDKARIESAIAGETHRGSLPAASSSDATTPMEDKSAGCPISLTFTMMPAEEKTVDGVINVVAKACWAAVNCVLNRLADIIGMTKDQKRKVFKKLIKRCQYAADPDMEGEEIC